MAPQIIAQEEGGEQAMQEQAAQYQQMQQQRSISLANIAFSRRRRMAHKLLAKAAFRRQRASEHNDLYFQFVFGLAGIADFADGFDGVIGFIVMIFTFWVPLLIRGLFAWGPRNYVWHSDSSLFLLGIAQIAVKWTPWLRALPANSSNVMIHWLASIEHKEIDIRVADRYEKIAKKLLKRK